MTGPLADGVLSQLIPAPRGTKWSDQVRHPPMDQQVDLGLYLSKGQECFRQNLRGIAPDEFLDNLFLMQRQAQNIVPSLGRISLTPVRE
ncbi:hypothetical protein N7475_008858 [Penicillium sp. IBT 31633x]|nr:hypothetical protein N7475_008858 [Penicillium sp. IBT 31633x]